MLSFLERVVSEEGICTNPDKIKTVQDWPRPKTPKQMRGFLGLCSYYHDIASALLCCLPGDVNTSFNLIKACSHSSFH
jgi:hypothetical protein